MPKSTDKLKMYIIFNECISALREGNYNLASQHLSRINCPPEMSSAVALYMALKRKIEVAAKPQSPVGHSILEKLPRDKNNKVNDISFVIVTPTRNSAKYISETISSVFSQKGDFKIYYHVQDSGSTDCTQNILKDRENIISRFASPTRVEFSWASESDTGMYEGIGRGFRHIFDRHSEINPHSTIMCWINSDDLFPINSLRTAASFFREHQEINWITGLGALINEAGELISVDNFSEAFSRSNLELGLHDNRTLKFVQQEGTFWRRTLWDEVDGLASETYFLAGDWDLWRRMATITPLVRLNSVLGLHRRHQNQLTNNMERYYSEIDSEILPRSQQKGSKSCLSAVYDSDMSRWNIISDSRVPEDIVDGDVVRGENCAKESIGGKVQGGKEFTPATLPSGRPWPKISVITPSFNQGKYIRETLDSVLHQQYPNVEHIVIDGGSNDETVSIIEEYAHFLAYHVSEPDGGQSAALNKGFERATGEILCWLNSDDQFAPGALFAVALAFDTHEVDLVSGICEIFSDDVLIGRHIAACPDGILPIEDLLDLDGGWNSGEFFYQPEVFFSRSIWERSGGHVREDYYYSMDYELWCRFALSKARLHVIGIPLAKFRSHPEQKTADPTKFKRELITVREQLITSNKIEVVGTGRNTSIPGSKLQVAMVNDLGVQYGAGIAHGRIAAGIDLAGHSVRIFNIGAGKELDRSDDEISLLGEVSEFDPDIVIFGNLHAGSRDSIFLISELSKRYFTFWVTHDFWLFTGRCAYPGSCAKYLVGCDEQCPTAGEYPDLAESKIKPAWLSKRKLMGGENAPVVLANSHWSFQFAKNAMRPNEGSPNAGVYRFKLGAPVNCFRKIPKAEARMSLGVRPDSFVIAFSASSLADKRKGAIFLREALVGLNIDELEVILIGHAEDAAMPEGIDVVSIGYVNDPATLNSAISAADIFIGPSLEETFGQVFIEAALAGTPSIGFNQSGVTDSIIEGVTGFRVACSVGALRDSIYRLYKDRVLRESVGFWAHIYARNEFSLEASYRSLFDVWRECGLVDKFNVRHNIGFSKDSIFVADPSGTVPDWRPEKGISPLEGPYPPDFPLPLRWCHGKDIKIKLRFSEPGMLRLRLSYHCPLFDSLDISVGFSRSEVVMYKMFRTTGGESKVLDIVVESYDGWRSLGIWPENTFLESGGAGRHLAFMLLGIEISRHI